MAKILIIEDDPSFRKMLRLLLESSGYEVNEAENGVRGLSLFRQDPADLIITDIFMPEEDGFGVLRALNRDYPGTKVIIISGGGNRGALHYLQYAEMFGAAKCLAKPFENEVLLDAVREVLES